MRSTAPQAFALLAATVCFSAGVISCSSPPQPCGPQSCATGCCDEDGACQTHGLPSDCGVGGMACQTCGDGQSCGAGGCYGPSSADGGSDVPDAGGGLCKSDGVPCLSPVECCAAVCTDGQCGTPPSCNDTSGDRATQVCLRWNCDRANLTTGPWSGDVDACDAGDNPVDRENVLRIVNLYRFLANLPEVTTSPERDEKAQACALMMRANNTLDHFPPTTWSCYSDGGAEAARSSNLAPVAGAFAVDVYMGDGSSVTTLGHRRWLLSPELGPIGSGTVMQASCLWVTKGRGTAQRDYVAWPPRGPFPLQAFSAGSGADINKSGWSIQSYTIDLSSATVTVSDETGPLPILQNVLEGQPGSTWAIRFKPDGWIPQAGSTYTVSVTDVSTPFSYGVQVVDCG